MDKRKHLQIGSGHVFPQAKTPLYLQAADCPVGPSHEGLIYRHEHSPSEHMLLPITIQSHTKEISDTYRHHVLEILTNTVTFLLLLFPWGIPELRGWGKGHFSCQGKKLGKGLLSGV